MENTTSQNPQTEKHGKGLLHTLNETLTNYAAQSWPILMVILCGLGLIALLLGAWYGKIIGILLIVFGVLELRRYRAAKKAGETYAPVYAKFAYLALVAIVVYLIWYLTFGVNSPKNLVKDATFDAFDHSIGYIVEHNLEDVSWETQKSEDGTYVYVYGTTLDGDFVGLEFLYTEMGDHYWIEVSDGFFYNSWMGSDMAFIMLAAMDQTE